MRVTNTGCSDPRGVAKFGNKKAQLIAVGLGMVVAWGRIELPTRGFSVRCSTN